MKICFAFGAKTIFIATYAILITFASDADVKRFVET
jgi:hypothetical protein